MICGALQTLNEEAFEDVVCSERPTPSPTGQAPGEMMPNNNTNNISTSTQLPPHLAPIRESVEFGSFSELDPYDHFHSSVDLGYGNNNIQSNYSNSNIHHNNHAYVLLEHLPIQQQCHLDNVHNETLTVDQQQYHRNVLRGPLPTVIVMPSSTVDDTPL